MRHVTAARVTGRVVMLLAVALAVVGHDVAIYADDTAKEQSTAHAAQWLSYRNAATGLSFRYPPSLRIHERDPKAFGLPDTEEITDLIGDTNGNPDTIALRFIVQRGETTPEMAAAKARSERARYATYTDSRYSITTIELDGRDALVEVSCGARGPACHWSVNVLQPRDCAIFTMMTEPIEDTFAPPHDGTFPLLSIIETVHLERGPKPDEATH
jgi:hypothetical protein